MLNLEQSRIDALAVAIEEYLNATGYVPDVEKERRALIVALCKVTGEEIPKDLQEEDCNAQVNWDEAYYLSTGNETLYFQVWHLVGGWFVSADIGHLPTGSAPLLTEDGPHPTETDAIIEGLKHTSQWMFDYQIYDYEIDPRLYCMPAVDAVINAGLPMPPQTKEDE